MPHRPCLRHACAALILAAASGPALAAPPPAAPGPAAIAPPETPRTATANPAAARPGDFEEIAAGGLAVEFGRTRLEDVRRSGGGIVGARAGQPARWLCYTVESGRRLWFRADDAARGVVTSVTLSAQPGAAGEDGCPALPTRMLPVSTINGIQLGDRREAVHELLGPARATEYATYRSCTGPAACTTVTLRYNKNRVIEITAAQAPA